MTKNSENIRIRNIIDIKNNITFLSKEQTLYYSSFFNYNDGINIAYEQGVEFNNR